MKTYSKKSKMIYTVDVREFESIFEKIKEGKSDVERLIDLGFEFEISVTFIKGEDYNRKSYKKTT